MSEKSLSEELKGYADGLRQDVGRGVEYPKSAIRAVAGWIEQRAKQAVQLEAENDVLRNTISLLKNENERMMKLAHDYITAYEKLAFGEEQGDETE